MRPHDEVLYIIDLATLGKRPLTDLEYSRIVTLMRDNQEIVPERLLTDSELEQIACRLNESFSARLGDSYPLDVEGTYEELSEGGQHD